MIFLIVFVDGLYRVSMVIGKIQRLSDGNPGVYDAHMGLGFILVQVP